MEKADPRLTERLRTARAHYDAELSRIQAGTADPRIMEAVSAAYAATGRPPDDLSADAKRFIHGQVIEHLTDVMDPQDLRATIAKRLRKVEECRRKGGVAGVQGLGGAARTARYFRGGSTVQAFGRSGVADAFKANSTALSVITGTGFADAMTFNSRVADLCVSLGFKAAMKLDRQTLAGITTTPGFVEAMKLNTQALAGITENAGFKTAMKRNTQASPGSPRTRASRRR